VWRDDLLEYPGYTERVNPMDYKALSAALANVELTHEGIAEFVTKYGFLEIGASEGKGETFAKWREEVTLLRIVWRRLHGRPQAEGEEFVLKPLDPLIEGLTLYYYDVPGHAGGVTVPDGPIPERRALERVLATIISEHTMRLVGAQVDMSTGYPNVIFVPLNLLGAAWLQMAYDLASSEPSEYRNCPACKQMYRVVRKEQVTCGKSKCRAAMYQRRRDRARQLSDEGMTPAKVAAAMTSELGEKVTASQAAKWIDASQKRRPSKRVR
jgi:hypothetical protein